MGIFSGISSLWSGRVSPRTRARIQFMITGAVLLAAVTIDALARRQRERVQVA
jgi:ABC-type xylose transport system permease subunit